MQDFSSWGRNTAGAPEVARAFLWASALCAFACVTSYAAALVLLFLAGFFELSFSAMAQTIVQLNAPAQLRGGVALHHHLSQLVLDLPGRGLRHPEAAA